MKKFSPRQVCDRENILAMNMFEYMIEIAKVLKLQYSGFFNVKLTQYTYSTMLSDKNSTNFVNKVPCEFR